MLGLHYRSAYAIALGAGVALAALLPGAAAASEPEVRSSMQCDRASEPGRVRCTVEARVEGGRTIAWADVEILSLPDFASALKGRIGPQDALSRDPTNTRWGLGLVARRSGTGEVRARVRVVACEALPAGAPASAPRTRCAPIVVEVKASVIVG